jgi:ABC-type sugar transport system substrate-binding protein
MLSKMTKLKLRFITIAVNEEFFAVVRKGTNDAAAAMQLEADLIGTPGVTAQELIKLTRQAIADRVDRIALNVFEPNTFAEVLAEAKSQSIPVVGFNIDATNPLYAAP